MTDINTESPFHDMNEEFYRAIEIDNKYRSELVDYRIDEVKHMRENILDRPNDARDSSLHISILKEINTINTEIELEEDKEKRMAKMKLLYLLQKKNHSMMFAYFSDVSLSTQDEYHRELGDAVYSINEWTEHIKKYEKLASIRSLTIQEKLKMVESSINLKWHQMWLAKLQSIRR
jgi:hypothetical protein